MEELEANSSPRFNKIDTPDFGVHALNMTMDGQTPPMQQQKAVFPNPTEARRDCGHANGPLPPPGLGTPKPSVGMKPQTLLNLHKDAEMEEIFQDLVEMMTTTTMTTTMTVQDSMNVDMSKCLDVETLWQCCASALPKHQHLNLHPKGWKDWHPTEFTCPVALA
eukprot:3538959-Amphidinium_carterae.1